MDDPIIIAAAKRTAIGNFQGCFKDHSSVDLGAAAIKGALKQSQLAPNNIDAVYMGCVLPAGLGQAPARQAAIAADLPTHTPCVTVNKMCGSGLQTIIYGHDSILAGTNQIVIAGGMESMTNAPYLLPKAREGYRLGHKKVIDSMFLDGLEDAYDKGKLMGVFAENCVTKYNFTREQCDDFAIASVERAQQATADGNFSDEIVSVDDVHQDEGPLTAKKEKIPKLKPAFDKNGAVTPANSSSISDGAASVVLMRQSIAKENKITPLAKIISHTVFAQESAWFTTAPIAAIQKLFSKTGWTVDDVDLFEINEAFAVVTMATMHDLNIPHEKVNVHGGACVLGHPIGASGARILVTLIYALQQAGKKRGVAAICIGGGEALAIGIENVYN